MKFLADMGISHRTVAFLRDAGYEAVHLHEEGLDRLPDPEILQKARDEEQVVVTFDLDFADLMAASGATLPSVIIFRLRNMRPDSVNRYMQIVFNDHQQALQDGAIISVSEAQLRVRRLPIGGPLP